MNLKKLLFLLFASAMLFNLSCSEEEEPEPDPREIITGNWICDEQEVGTSNMSTYEVNVTELSGSDDGLKLGNFGNLHGDIMGYLDGNDVDIPYQIVNSIPIEGTGYIFNDMQSNWQYSIVIQGDTVEFIAGFNPKY